MEINEPKTEQEKQRLAKNLYEELKHTQEIKDKVSWIEGKILFYYEKFGLHNYLFGKPATRTSFYAEIDIPTSTVAFKRSIYEFYVEKHGFSIDELKNANTKKLFRALTYIKDYSKEKVKEVIGLAEREKLSLSDFLVSLGAPEKYCVSHKPTTVEKCKDCGKTLHKD